MENPETSVTDILPSAIPEVPQAPELLEHPEQSPHPKGAPSESGSPHKNCEATLSAQQEQLSELQRQVESLLSDISRVKAEQLTRSSQTEKAHSEVRQLLKESESRNDQSLQRFKKEIKKQEEALRDQVEQNVFTSFRQCQEQLETLTASTDKRFAGMDDELKKANSLCETIIEQTKQFADMPNLMETFATIEQRHKKLTKVVESTRSQLQEAVVNLDRTT